MVVLALISDPPIDGSDHPLGSNVRPLRHLRNSESADFALRNPCHTGHHRGCGAEISHAQPVSLAAGAVFADYHVGIHADLRAQAQREGRVEAFHEAGAVIALKASKGRQETIDLKRCVTRIEWADDALFLDLRLQEPSGHVLGPLHVLREIFKWSDVDVGRCRVTRLLMRAVDRSPLG
jgi:hypothetical protein